MIALLCLVAVCGALVAQNVFLQVRHSVERKAWDEERRIYIATTLASQHSQAAAAAVVKPKAEKPAPAPAGPVQVDL